RESDTNPQDEKDDHPPADDLKKSQPGQMEQGPEQGDGAEPKNVQAEKQPGAGDKATDTRDKNAGQGNQQPLPDQDEVVPMTPDRTAASLHAIAQRILRERQASRNLGPSTGRNVKDW